MHDFRVAGTIRVSYADLLDFMTTASPIFADTDHKKELAALKRAIAKSNKDPGDALKALIATGMYSKSGKLKKQFR